MHPAKLFLALWPGPRALAGALAWQAAHCWPEGARLTRPEHVHLTLHFLGQVPRERLPELEQGLKVPFRRFDMILDHAEVWPNNVAVLQPRAVPDALRDLHARLGLAVQRLGLPLNGRPFQPHVTLARHARGAVLVGRCEPVRWRSGACVLAESKGGYQVVTRFD